MHTCVGNVDKDTERLWDIPTAGFCKAVVDWEDGFLHRWMVQGYTASQQRKITSNCFCRETWTISPSTHAFSLTSCFPGGWEDTAFVSSEVGRHYFLVRVTNKAGLDCLSTSSFSQCSSSSAVLLPGKHNKWMWSWVKAPSWGAGWFLGRLRRTWTSLWHQWHWVLHM